MIQIPKKLKKLLNALHPQMPKGTISDATSWVKQQRSKAKADTMRGWVKPWVEEIHDEETIIFSQPNTLEESIHPNFIKHYFATTSQSSIYVIYGARIIGREGYVISPDNKVFEEFTYCSTKPGNDYDVFYRLRLPAIETRSGWWATITYPDAAEFFHFKLECFPRLSLLEKFEPILDGIVVPKNLKKFHLSLLNEIGFSDERLLKIDSNSHIKFDNLIVPSFIAGKNIPAWVPTFYKKQFIRKAVKPFQLVYISREDALHRNIINSSEVEELLMNLGFTKYVMSTLSSIEQRELFSSAKIIVAPHGAALSNLVYSQNTLNLLEIFSPHYVDGTYWTIVQAIAGKYWYMLGTQTPRNEELKSAFENILVDIEKLKKTISIIIQNC